MPRPSASIDLFDLVLDRLAEALAGRLKGPSRGGGGALLTLAPRAHFRRKGEKRQPALLAQTTDELLSYIKTNPGQRIEQIAEGLGLSTQELKLPAQKLLAGRKVKTRGQRRGTRYTAA